MKQFIKQLFCRHKISDLNRWHVTHGPNAMDPPEIEAEYICKNCGKILYRHASIKYIHNYEEVCKQYERRIQ